MLAFEPLDELLSSQAPYRRDALVDKAVADVRASRFPGVPDDRIEAVTDGSQDGGADAIIVGKVDPSQAAGYLAFQSDDDYQRWLQASLHQPSQDEVAAAARET